MSAAAWAAVASIATAVLTLAGTLYATRRADLAKLDERTAASKRDAAAAWQGFAEKMEARLERLETEVRDLRTQLAAKDETIAARDAHILQLEDDIRDRDFYITQLVVVLRAAAIEPPPAPLGLVF